MCGRYSFVTSEEKIKQQLGNHIDIREELQINFNIAPTHKAYIITNDEPTRLQHIMWGLVPYWSKEGKNSGKLINARSEGIASKPSFRMSIRQRRCLILADSFYEWRREGSKKLPFRIFLKSGELLLLAGIWDVWEQNDQRVKSFSIITTPPNKEMQSIHNRMPVIFNTLEKQAEWLQSDNLDHTLNMLKTPKNGLLDMYRVSEKVNSVRNNSVELHQKIVPPPTLF